jgi:hypothetical protein
MKKEMEDEEEYVIWIFVLGGHREVRETDTY